MGQKIHGLSNYNKPGHTIKVCFKKCGLPPSLKKMNLAQTIGDSTNNNAHDQVE